MITSAFIKDQASFDEQGVTIENLQKINIIYGANGSGKSTIGNILNHEKDYPFCKVSWSDNSPLKVICYNKEFREKNFLLAKEIPGVFTLGEENTFARSEISLKKAEQDRILQLGLSYKRNSENINKQKELKEDALKDYLWDKIYKAYPEFAEAFKKDKRSKVSLRDATIAHYKCNRKNIYTLQELQKRAKLLFNSEPQLLTKLSLISDVDLIKIEQNNIWKSIIVGKQDIDLAKLINKLGITDWVSRGKAILEHNDSDLCPFCQQHTITQEFKQKLSQFFDEEYESKTTLIAKNLTKYRQEIERLRLQINDLKDQYKTNPDILKALIPIETISSILDTQLIANTKQMELKTREPNQNIFLFDNSTQLAQINESINQCNQDIERRNQIVANYQKEKTALIDNIWSYCININKEYLDNYTSEMSDMDKALKNLEEKRNEARKNFRTLDIEIKDLENTQTSVLPTVNEINRLLKAYGFTNFKIQETKTGSNFYHIIREDGTDANKTLSEGEATFISFLYYMQVVKGSFSSTDITTNRVLVIDDPVSSLDSNILFIVSTMIKDLFYKVSDEQSPIKQIILLTHNVYFHKQISYTDKPRKSQNRPHYWILRKSHNKTSIQAYLENNPIKN